MTCDEYVLCPACGTEGSLEKCIKEERDRDFLIDQARLETLKAIADAQTLDEIRKADIGVGYTEYLEMAYENLKFAAKLVI
jgi:hypothetical protein